MDALGWLLAGLVGPLFWWVVLGLSLWLVRLVAPSWERFFFTDLLTLVRQRIQAARRVAVLHPDSEPRRNRAGEG